MRIGGINKVLLGAVLFGLVSSYGVPAATQYTEGGLQRTSKPPSKAAALIDKAQGKLKEAAKALPNAILDAQDNRAQRAKARAADDQPLSVSEARKQVRKAGAGVKAAEAKLAELQRKVSKFLANHPNSVRLPAGLTTKDVEAAEKALEKAKFETLSEATRALKKAQKNSALGKAAEAVKKKVGAAVEAVKAPGKAMQAARDAKRAQADERAARDAKKAQPADNTLNPNFRTDEEGTFQREEGPLSEDEREANAAKHAAAAEQLSKENDTKGLNKMLRSSDQDANEAATRVFQKRAQASQDKRSALDLVAKESRKATARSTNTDAKEANKDRARKALEAAAATQEGVSNEATDRGERAAAAVDAEKSASRSVASAPGEATRVRTDKTKNLTATEMQRLTSRALPSQPAGKVPRPATPTEHVATTTTAEKGTAPRVAAAPDGASQPNTNLARAKTLAANVESLRAEVEKVKNQLEVEKAKNQLKTDEKSSAAKDEPTKKIAAKAPAAQRQQSTMPETNRARAQTK